tara:strand:- start:542 stop:703 length:162 start_codon:yes stop_codon:yes gene_type:complete
LIDDLALFPISLKGEYQFRTDIEERNIFDHEFKELWCVELEGTVDEVRLSLLE